LCASNNSLRRWHAAKLLLREWHCNIDLLTGVVSVLFIDFHIKVFSAVQPFIIFLSHAKIEQAKNCIGGWHRKFYLHKHPIWFPASYEAPIRDTILIRYDTDMPIRNF
jgi:hypothetical protein